MEKKSRYKVLVVDDDREMTNSYSEILGHRYTIQVLESGIQAVDKIRTDKDIDMVVLDHKMPDLSGIEVLKKIKENKPDLPVLIVTGYGDEDLAVKSFRCGARDYIKKPFCFNDLSDRIALYLANTGKGRDAGLIPHYEYRPDIMINHSVIDHSNSYKIQKAISFVHENFMEEATLNMAAARACMSKRHFCRVFKKAIGMTYQNYINSCRIKKAKEMLCAKYSITEVAFAVGYSDITHFGRIFKKAVGCTPSQYKYERTSSVFDNQV